MPHIQKQNIQVPNFGRKHSYNFLGKSWAEIQFFWNVYLGSKMQFFNHKTSVLISLLTSYGKKTQNTSIQPRRIQVTKKHHKTNTNNCPRLTNNDIYLTHTDFRNYFGSIDRAIFFTLMENLGYPKDAFKQIGNICTNSNHLLPRQPLWCITTNPN